MIKTFVYTLAFAVVLGAFGAHALKEALTAEQLDVWKTAVLYHFLHALGGVLLALVPMQFEVHQKRLQWASRFMFIGILLFSGSLYVLSIRHLLEAEYLRILGPITPLGGVCFVLAWVFAGLAINGKRLHQ